MDKKKLVNLMADKGMTQAAIYGVMKGRKPTLPTLGKIAKALGVKPSELLDM